MYFENKNAHNLISVDILQPGKENVYQWSFSRKNITLFCKEEKKKKTLISNTSSSEK